MLIKREVRIMFIRGIIVFTLLLILSIGFILFKGKKEQLQQQGIKQISCIVHTYKGCFYQHNKVMRVAESVLLIFILVCYTSYFGLIIRQEIRDTISIWKVAGVVLISIAAMALICWVLGYLLMSLDSIHQKEEEQKDESVKLCLLLNNSIISLYAVIFLLYGNRVVVYYKWIIAFLAAAQLLNLTAFIKVLSTPEKNPGNQKSSPGQESSFGRTIITALLLIVIAFMGIYLGVCYTAVCFPGSYEGGSNFQDLFYYVVENFVAIGYGNIAPVSVQAKYIAIVTAVSSTVYIVLFLAKIISTD